MCACVCVSGVDGWCVYCMCVFVVTCTAQCMNMKGRPRRIYNNKSNLLNDKDLYLYNKECKSVVKFSIMNSNQKCNAKSV